MSTITKELAKLFRKITNSEIDAEGNAHVVLSPADSLLINNARIALASLEAEAVACIDRANLDYLESGADADVWPASGAGSDDVLLYAAPQLPQPAVADISRLEDVLEWINSLPVPTKSATANYCRLKNFITDYRASMLQAGNSPVIPDGWKLVPIDPTKDMLRAGQSVVGFWLNTVHCYSKMLAAAPAAPQQQ